MGEIPAHRIAAGCGDPDEIVFLIHAQVDGSQLASVERLQSEITVGSTTRTDKMHRDLSMRTIGTNVFADDRFCAAYNLIVCRQNHWCRPVDYSFYRREACLSGLSFLHIKTEREVYHARR